MSRPAAISLVTICVILPLTLMRKVKSLWFTGFMAITFVCIFVIALLAKLIMLGVSDPASGPSYGRVYAVNVSVESFFQALPIAV